MPVNVQRYISAADRALTRLENAQVRKIDQHLRRAQADLERDLKRRYSQALNEIKTMNERELASRAFVEARARVVAEGIQANLRAFEMGAGTPVSREVREAIRGAYELGTEQAGRLLQAYLPGEEVLGVGFNADAVRMASQNSAARLHRHSQDFIEKAQDVVISGLVRGQGVTRTTAELKRELKILRWEAERLCRTETLQANDEARRESYAENGVEHVQRIATQDSRVCPYCAARAGRVYRVDEAPAALHPNDRCYNAPWKQEWVDLGLIDEDWAAKHREETIAKLPEDVNPSYGLAPFEKYAGLDKPPEYVWSPERLTPPEPQPLTAQAVRERLLEIPAEIEREQEALRDELRGFIDRDYDRAQYYEQAIANAPDKATERQLLKDQIQEKVRNQEERRPIYDALRRLEDDQIPRARSLLAVDTPANFEHVYRSDVFTGERKQTIEEGIEGFKQLVGLPSLEGETINIHPDPGNRSFHNGLGIHMSEHAPARLTVHELGHWLEAEDAQVHREALAFYDRRTAGETLRPLGAGYRDDEYTRPDDFINPYMGKEYEWGGKRYATEIVSMGLEHMYADPVSFAAKDPDYFDFMYNLLRGK